MAAGPRQAIRTKSSNLHALLDDAAGRHRAELLRRRAVVSAFHLDADADEILRLMEKYAHMPMSLADACLVRMTEVLTGPVLLPTDPASRICRRHSRQTVSLPHPG